ncbi:hypothetical protein A5N15_04200 [Rothia kristinae]|uniref:Uncharacterized protein n=1 Tax=Rothia kristinae TaxID=37923 RepID=A0A657IV04_9MICC|nr:hypothetical protein A5N15_04200 [Rothia kristinae]
MTRVSSTLGFFSAVISSLALVIRLPAVLGAVRHRATRTAAAIALISTKHSRHPATCPSRVKAGTPTIVATVMPSCTLDTARACLVGRVRLEAKSMATPMNAPCGMPERNRASTRVPIVGPRPRRGCRGSARRGGTA